MNALRANRGARVHPRRYRPRISRYRATVSMPLSWDELALCLALSSVVFIGVEIEKALVRRGWIYLSRA